MAALQRLRVPSQNGEVLAVPGFKAIPSLIEQNRRQLNRSDVKICSLPLNEFRAIARSEVLALSESPQEPSGPLIVTGHQPELSHPGVWVKNFVLNGLARKVGGIPLNLIVDNDTLKTAALHFPAFQSGDPFSVHQESLAFDAAQGELPYEDRQVFDEQIFHSFPERAKKHWQNWGYQPLLPRVWKNDRTIGDAFVSARRGCERAWGCRNLELSVSRLSQTRSFGQFAKHIFDDLSRFREVYNAAIMSYRRANHLKSHSHPAPELAKDEAPFWEQTSVNGGRKRATTSSDIHALRPRALTLTLFARLCVADFFIHGIGGGKYDAVTDQIIRDYFGIEPPAYQVVSATLQLPLPNFPTTAESVRQAERNLRDLKWNPQYYIDPKMAGRSIAVQLLAEKEKLIRSEPSLRDHQGRREWFRSFQRVTEQLRSFVSQQIPQVEELVRRRRAELEANRILQRRDYAWVLYPEQVLRPFLQQFLNLD